MHDDITRRALLAMADLIGPDKPCKSQRDFASRVGITPQAVTKWQAGTQAITAVQCARLAAEFNVNGHWLLTGAGVRLHSENTTLEQLTQRITALEQLWDTSSSPSTRKTTKTSSRPTTRRRSTR
ncbi:MAG TPA: helix-turn-helix transcriptional regulator [Chitinophagales bacterium]|nr:helix-turn-helix transcriptional regulator [Chitinophagales bacterium]